MNIIKPESVTETKLISTNVPETDAPAWSNVTAYTIGQQVIYLHHVYQALTNNTNKQPDINTADWLDMGATNRYRLFDSIVSNPTTNSDSIDFTVRLAAIIGGVALFGLTAATAQVIVTDPVDGVVYDTTKTLTDYSNINSYFSYQFEPVAETMDSALFLDLPTYPAADIRVIISNGAAIASCGEAVFGMLNAIGVSNFGTKIGIRDYSRKEIDQFGNFVIVERKFAKVADYDVTLETADLARIQRKFAEIRATPCVFIGDDARDETVVFGFYKDFATVISAPSVSNCNIQVEGLT